MSSRSHTSGHDRYHHGSDDVERYRQRSRQSDRRYREEQEDDGRHNKRNQKTDRGGEVVDRHRKLAREREERMARLREELKKEDETLAALDQHQAGKEQTGGGADRRARDKKQPQETIIEVRPEELEGLDEEEQMQKLLGFDGFGSTKGQVVEDNQSTAARGGAAKNKARKYRQYMNRKNGFNRPLEKMN